MDSISDEFRLLADPVRLRTLRLLAREELSGGEVAQALGVAASTVSKHLAQLRTAGFVADRRDGRHAYFVVPAGLRDDGRWRGLFERLAAEPDTAGDLARLDDLLRKRREGREEGAAKAFVPGRSWTAWARAVSFLVPPGLRAVDLGCGDGALTLEIARFADAVVGVDRKDAAVRAAEARAAKRGAKNAQFVALDFLADDVPGGPFDLAVLSQVLQLFDSPGAPLAAARRALRRGGRVIVLDLLPHRETWVRERLGHRHQGFQTAQLDGWLADAGFRDRRVERVAGGPKDPFQVVLATAVAGGSSR